MRKYTYFFGCDGFFGALKSRDHQLITGTSLVRLEIACMVSAMVRRRELIFVGES